MSLCLDASLDRPLVREDAAFERYLMLTLKTPAGAVRRPPLNLALVIDCSGSMAGQKLARVKEAAGFVVRHLTGADRVAVVAYHDEVAVVAPSALLTPQAKVDLLGAVRRIEADGMTNLSGGWLTGCQEVAKHQNGDNVLHRTLLLTDGLANVGVTAIEELVEHARQLRLRGMVTSTMGVGSDFNEELLEAIARHGGGRFQYVETAQHIPDCIQGELGEMLQLSARKVAVEVSLPEQVRCVHCLNGYGLEQISSGVRVHLGDVLAGDTRRVILQLAAGPGEIGRVFVVKSLVMYVEGATGHGTEEAFPAAELRCADQAAVDSQVTNDEVGREVELLLVARAKEDAVRLSRAGNPAAAATMLAAAGRALSASPYRSDPTMAGEAAFLASMAADAAQGLAEHQHKELRYQSYLAREARRRYDGPRRPV